MLGIALGEALDMPVLDGVASLMIGLLLATASVILAVETKGLLIGESASIELDNAIRAIVQNTPGVTHVNELLTMHMGPRDVLLNVSFSFADPLSAEEVEAAVDAMETHIQTNHPEVKKIFLEVQSKAGHLASLKKEEK
jgi:divalent metal cation (Fe/Co/Zn/Cd) transporter